MKKFLTTSVILLALVFGALGAFVPSAQAVDGPLLPLPGELGADIVPARTPAPAVAAPASGAPAAAVDKAAADSPTSLKTDSGVAFSGIMGFIMSLFAWLVGVAAITLDKAVYLTVVTMGEYVNSLSAIGITWRILRDVGNILLIFGFIAIGISTILNTEKLGYGKKALPMLLVAAVFLNFSLFISEAIIDTGNLFATQFYTQINGGQLAGEKEFGFGQVEKEGISNKIMGQLGLATIYGEVTTNPNLLNAETPWFVGFMGILLFIILAFVMFSLAFILIARFVILVFLIIISPVAFAGYAIPKLQSSAAKWWHALIDQTITAPVLMLLLYIALRVITDDAFLSSTKKADWLAWAKNAPMDGFGGIMLSFLIAMGLLLGVVILSKKLSAFGAAGATKLAGKLSFGLAAAGMRSTVGWGLNSASQGVRRRWGGTKTGRILATTFDKGAKGSFDIRGATIGGGLKGIGVAAGDAAKGGYKARLDASVKGHQDYMKSVNEAIDERGVTRKDIANVEESKRKAQEAQEVAKNSREAASASVNERRAEVARIEDEKRKDIYWTTDPKNEQRLNDAKQKLTMSESDLAKATSELAKAEKLLESTLKQTVEDEAKSRATKEKKTAQDSYVKNIKGPFFGNSIPGWVEFGPGGALAAHKIVKGKKNTVDLDEMKKFLEEKDKSKEAAEDKPAESTAT